MLNRYISGIKCSSGNRILGRGQGTLSAHAPILRAPPLRKIRAQGTHGGKKVHRSQSIHFFCFTGVQLVPVKVPSGRIRSAQRRYHTINFSSTTYLPILATSTSFGYSRRNQRSMICTERRGNF